MRFYSSVGKALVLDLWLLWLRSIRDELMRLRFSLQPKISIFLFESLNTDTVRAHKGIFGNGCKIYIKKGLGYLIPLPTLDLIPKLHTSPAKCCLFSLFLLSTFVPPGLSILVISTLPLVSSLFPLSPFCFPLGVSGSSS